MEGLSEHDSFDGEYYQLLDQKIKDTIFSYFPTTTFVFFVGEKNKKGNLHLHYLVSIRNFIDYNYCLRNSLHKVFKEDIELGPYACSNDVKVDSLLYFKDIKN